MLVDYCWQLKRENPATYKTKESVYNDSAVFSIGNFCLFKFHTVKRERN